MGGWVWAAQGIMEKKMETIGIIGIIKGLLRFMLLGRRGVYGCLGFRVFRV